MKQLRQMFAGLLRLHFLSFVAKCIETVDPGATYVESWHILVLAAKLELVQRGLLRRLMINLPPRSLKTHIVSVAFCAWVLGHDPTKRIICVTYSNDVAKTQAKGSLPLLREPGAAAQHHQQWRARYQAASPRDRSCGRSDDC